MKSFERDYPAHVRLDPVEGRIVGAFCHGKNAARISLEQHFRRDFDKGAFAVCHDADPGTNPGPENC
jgi:hypothetical protein